MNIFFLDQQPLLTISKILIPCCLALIVEAALQLWGWKMLTSILAFDISPFIHLNRLSEQAFLRCFPYVIVSLPWLLPILLFHSLIYNFKQFVIHRFSFSLKLWYTKGSSGCFGLVCLRVLFGSEMALPVWTVTLAKSIANNASFLLSPRSMNKTAIFPV